jgi:hypothetical protein
MGQFKPMVKMMTTEPSVTLKLKKGGTVKKPVKKMDGGIMGALANAPAAGGPAMPSAGIGRRMAARKGRRPSPPTLSPMGKPGSMPDMPPPPMGSPGVGSNAEGLPMRPPMGGGPSGRPMIPPAPMKKGGETPKMHAKEMTKMSNLEKEMKHHESMKASKAHNGLKTGGVVKGQGGYKDGGVVNGQGGFKKGGAAKKPFATGGRVESGAPVAMPKKPVSAPVHVDRLAGTFKRGGKVK